LGQVGPKVGPARPSTEVPSQSRSNGLSIGGTSGLHMSSSKLPSVSFSRKQTTVLNFCIKSVDYCCNTFKRSLFRGRKIWEGPFSEAFGLASS